MTSKIFKNKITLRVLTTFWLTATITFAHVWREVALQLFPHLQVKNTLCQERISWPTSWMHEVKIILRKRMDMTVFTKVIYYARKKPRIEESAKMVNTHHSLQSYYSLTLTYRCVRVCSSELIRILCQHPPPGIWLSILSWPEAGRLGGRQKTSK